MSPEGPAPLAAPEPSDPAGFHRRLAHWNHRRLAPATPRPAWRDDLRHDAEMMLVEGDFIERARAEAAPWLVDLPATADAFVAWFEALKGSGPGEADPLFPWLAETASMEEMRWFLLQEVAGEAGFEDLVAMAQVKIPTRPKLELARNYWDEMGRGSEAGMHGPMLDRLAAALDLKPRIEETAWPSLALGNTLVAFSTQRRYAYHALGPLASRPCGRGPEAARRRGRAQVFRPSRHPGHRPFRSLERGSAASAGGGAAGVYPRPG